MLTPFSELETYKQAILDELLSLTGDDGLPRLTTQQAQTLLNELHDSELLDGMSFNTPAEVAELLLEFL